MPGVGSAQAFRGYPKDLKREEWGAVNMTEELGFSHRHNDRVSQSNNGRRARRFVVDESEFTDNPALLDGFDRSSVHGYLQRARNHGIHLAAGVALDEKDRPGRYGSSVGGMLED